MKLTLKPLDEQVMVITGASSGIGLVTAKHAAQRGACVVLAARNEHDLQDATEDIRRSGGRAVYAAADVADRRRLTPLPRRRCGSSDASTPGSTTRQCRCTVGSWTSRSTTCDARWTSITGVRCTGRATAVQHLRRSGGALINVGSALSDRAIPLQGGYCAAKHALKAFTDALRMELEETGLPIAVTLVKPASIDTPFFEKARTYLGVEPQPVPPVYSPEVVSEVILHAAQHPLRELIAGGSGAKLSAARFAPRLADLYMERWTFDSQGTDKPADGRADNLYDPVLGRRRRARPKLGRSYPREQCVYSGRCCIHVRRLLSSRQWRSASGSPGRTSATETHRPVIKPRCVRRNRWKTPRR